MITLYTFGPLPGTPDPSIFVVKAMVLLKMAGLEYRTDTGGFRKAPKGKLPYIDDGGTIVSDSTFIRWHLEKTRGIDFDKGLTPAERGVAWAFEKLCEDNLYWAMMDSRWLDDANFARGPKRYFDKVPAPMRPFVLAMVRRGIRRSLHAQGLGRHARPDLERIAIAGIDAIAAEIGDKPWLMGREPCSADAVVWATVQGFMMELFEGPIRAAAQKHANLVAYRDRGTERWFPEVKGA